MIYRVTIFMILGASALAATARPAKTAQVDLFEEFRLLDKQFTKLSNDYHDLQERLSGQEPPKQARTAWRRELREMRRSTAKIRQMSRRMRGHSRRQSQELRYRMFALLDRKASVLNRRLVAMERVQSRTGVQQGSRKMRLAMVDLVLQYQAISGGYAATACDAGKWSCGVAKKEPRRVGYPRVGVKWTCAPRRNACKGILGPRTPLLNPKPLTAGAMPTVSR